MAGYLVWFRWGQPVLLAMQARRACLPDPAGSAADAGALGGAVPGAVAPPPSVPNHLADAAVAPPAILVPPVAVVGALVVLGRVALGRVARVPGRPASGFLPAKGHWKALFCLVRVHPGPGRVVAEPGRQPEPAVRAERGASGERCRYGGSKRAPRGRASGDSRSQTRRRRGHSPSDLP